MPTFSDWGEDLALDLIDLAVMIIIATGLDFVDLGLVDSELELESGLEDLDLDLSGMELDSELEDLELDLAGLELDSELMDLDLDLAGIDLL